ncbi:MAG: YegS/Rv2252/BmrU family lipid kinase [Clostridia bacterium]|nr:YegS/Rv2252/BmrU family lipid kinase [Clostridia bacterium]
MKHLFIINPKCGKGISYERCAETITETMTAMGIGNYEIHVTEGPRDGYEYTKKEVDKGEHIRVYACGGDGTLYEVVNACACKKNAEVAAFPLGSGNDFIRIFGDKKDLRNVADHVNGTVMDFDVIKCGDEYAINQCSMGLDAEVCAKQAYFKKFPFLSGELAYTVSLLYCFIGKMKSRFTITIDDGEPFTQNVLFCVGANSRWYGGGYKAAPTALTYDGLLDFVILEKRGIRLKLLPLISKYKKGEHLDWDITTFKRGKKINIKSEKPAAVNVDGECQYVTESTFEIIEKGIKFVVPACSDFMERVKNNNV